jgi:ribosome recycling factor
MIEDVLKDAVRRMDKSVENARHEFTTVRTGRASASLLDRVQVNAYGTKMPVNQLAARSRRSSAASWSPTSASPPPTTAS